MAEERGQNGHLTRKDLVDVEHRLMEAMRDMQTEILRGLERFSRGNFRRASALETKAPRR